MSTDALDFLFPFSTSFERNFNARRITQFHRDFFYLPVLTIALYLYVVVHLGSKYAVHLPKYMNFFLILWNASLCVFSLLGFFRVFPFFSYVLLSSHPSYLFCTSPLTSYGSGPVGLWVILFMWSKFIELFDTVLLVLRRKPLTFLHVFHHATVLLYCWFAGAAEQSTGIFFAVMNYGVHALMYFYYTCQALSRVGLGSSPTWGKLVTSVQLAQMALGVGVTVVHAWLIHGGDCEGNRLVLTAAAAMYTVYGALFAQFFAKRYSEKSKIV
jgi:hypothetical protein